MNWPGTNLFRLNLNMIASGRNRKTITSSTAAVSNGAARAVSELRPP